MPTHHSLGASAGFVLAVGIALDIADALLTVLLEAAHHVLKRHLRLRLLGLGFPDDALLTLLAWRTLLLLLLRCSFALRCSLLDRHTDLALLIHSDHLDPDTLPFAQKLVNVADIRVRNLRDVYHTGHRLAALDCDFNECTVCGDAFDLTFVDLSDFQLHKM